MDEYGIDFDNLNPVSKPETSLEDDIFGSSDPNPQPSSNIDDDEGELEGQDGNGGIDDNDSAIISFLKSRGIADPSKIQFQNEDGEIEEVNFDDLSKDEQLQLLNNVEAPLDLSNDEIEMLNFFRENNISLKDYITHQNNQAIENYKKNQEVAFTIDQLNDQELFVLDLKYKYPDLTDEELAIELENAVEDEALFAKKVGKLRKDYLELEKQQAEEAAQQQSAKEQEERQNLINTLVAEAQSVEDYHGLILDDYEKDEVLKFILDKDVNGNSEFYKMLSDPKKLLEIAWYAKKGKEAFETLHSYYKKEIDKVSRNNKSSNQPRTVVKKRKNREVVEDTYGLNEIFK